MRPIFTGDVTQITPDTLIIIDLGDPLIMQIQRLPLLHRLHGQASQIVNRFHPLRVEEIIQPIDHIFHDAKSVVHDRRADLNISRSQGNEFSGILPVRNSTNAGNRQTHLRIDRTGLHHIQGNRFDCRSAVTPMGASPRDIGFRTHRI